MSRNKAPEPAEKTRRRVVDRATEPTTVESLEDESHPLSRLQATLGNRRVARLIRDQRLTASATIKRQPVAAPVAPDERAPGAPIVEEASAETPVAEHAPLADDTKKGKADGASDKAAITGDAGFAIMKDAFGDLKKNLSKGKVKVLDQAAFEKAYDAIYGKTEYSWEKYVKPKFGNLRGLAHKGTNYVNKDAPSIDVGTVVHEMLHSNTASDWSGVVGNQFEEGTTEYLTIFAMKKAGIARTSAYDEQLDIVNALVADGLSDADLKTAYFKGGAKKLVADWFTGAMESSWTAFKTDMQNEDYAKAKAKIKKKAAGGAKK